MNTAIYLPLTLVSCQLLDKLVRRSTRDRIGRPKNSHVSDQWARLTAAVADVPLGQRRSGMAIYTAQPYFHAMPTHPLVMWSPYTTFTAELKAAGEPKTGHSTRIRPRTSERTRGFCWLNPMPLEARTQDNRTKVWCVRLNRPADNQNSRIVCYDIVRLERRDRKAWFG